MCVLLRWHSTDINECELGYCNHYCNNSVGSFTCSCQEGFALEDDDRTCVGKCIITNKSVGYVYNYSKSQIAGN